MKKILILLSFVSFLFSDSYPIFPIMYETGSIYSQAFHGGGSALLDGPLGQCLNPATVQAWHRIRQKDIAVSAGYFSDGISGNRFSGAASAGLTEKSVLAAEYLYYINDDKEPDGPIHRATFSYSASAFGGSDDEGGTLNYGVNVSYYNSNGQFSTPDSLSIITSTKATDSILVVKPSKYQNSVKNLYKKFNQISGDIGFYQLDENKGLSFSLVFENILGYGWYSKDPTLGVSTSYDTLGNTIIQTDSTVYLTEVDEGGDWISGRYKSILVGGASIIPLADEKLLLNIPLDFRFWGFGDKHLRKNSKFKERVEIHTGLELYFGPMLSGRFGYSWVERDLHTDSDGNPVFNPTHRISGGASFAFKFIMLEAAWRKGSWGAGVQLMF